MLLLLSVQANYPDAYAHVIGRKLKTMGAVVDERNTGSRSSGRDDIVNVGDFGLHCRNCPLTEIQQARNEPTYYTVTSVPL